MGKRAKRQGPDWDRWTVTMLAAVDLLDAVEVRGEDCPRSVRRAAREFRRVFEKQAARP